MLPSRRSPAHHRVLQCLLPCLRDRFEEHAGPPARQPARHRVVSGARRRRQLDQSGRGGPGECAQRVERRRHPCVRPVQQPGHDHSGGRVQRGHRRAGVMPGVAVPGRRGHVPGMHGGPGGGAPRGVAVGAGQREVQHPLHRQRGPDGRRRAVTASCERPDRRELRHDQDGHQSPGHRAFGDRVVAENGEHGAEHGEQTGPRARSRAAGPVCSGMFPVSARVIRWHGRPSSPVGRAPYARPSTTPGQRGHAARRAPRAVRPFVADEPAGGGHGRSPRRIRREGHRCSPGQAARPARWHALTRRRGRRRRAGVRSR